MSETIHRRVAEKWISKGVPFPLIRSRYRRPKSPDGVAMMRTVQRRSKEGVLETVTLDFPETVRGASGLRGFGRWNVV